MDTSERKVVLDPSVPAAPNPPGSGSTHELLDQLRAEVREARKAFAARLKAIREPLKSTGLKPDAFFTTTALFDGPVPEPLEREAVLADAAVFASAHDMLRSIRPTLGGSMCEMLPGDGVLSRFMLEHFVPSEIHLLDSRFDGLDPSLRGDPSVVLHEGPLAERIRDLSDDTLDLAVVNGLITHAETRRLLELVLAKVRPGGHLLVRNYAIWSIFSGIPYGVAGAVNAMANLGALRLIGFIPSATGYHQVLLRKPGRISPEIPKSDEAPRTDAPRTPLAASTAPHPEWCDAASLGLDAFLADFRTREGRNPSILDWTPRRTLTTAFPGLAVFSPISPDEERLPHIDASVDLVAIPLGDAARMDEARRVAISAVIEIRDGASGSRATIHPLGAKAPAVPATIPATLPATIEVAPLRRPLADRRILIVSHYMPQPDCDSYSRRLFHLVGFLRDAGCEVTCVAANTAGADSFSGLLTARGVRVLFGLDPRQLAELARVGRFDWTLFGFWNNAAPHLENLRKSAPDTRIVVDSGDVHFLRNARKILRDSDGMPGSLDGSFADAAAREIDVYAAADGVLAVSTKESDLIGDLIGDPSRSFTVPDTEYFPASAVPFAARRGMFLVGNFEHPPNAESLEYLCRRILPHVDPVLLAEHPVYVAGSNMTEAVRAIAAGVPGVRTVGWVPSVRPYLEQVRISLIPLLHGAGTKRKMIQALAIGTPTVSTSVGLEGFPIVHDRDVIVADDPVAFASGITRLLQDEATWNRLAAAGRTAICIGHVPEVAQERLLAALESVRVNPRRRNRVEGRTTAHVATEAAIDCPFRGRTPAHAVTAPTANGPAPRVSVVIPTRDRAPLLREALESLEAQDVDRDSFEVIVVNDGSTDATVGVCREFEGRLRLTRVDGPPSGIGLAKNIGIELAAAPIVLFFDDDDVADPGLVAAHLDAHGRAPLEHVAVLGFTDWSERLERTEVMRFVTDIGHYLFSYTFLKHGQLLDHTWFWGGRSSCKRSLLVRAGGFRPDFTFGSEDIEAGYRISHMIARERRMVGAAVPEGGLTVVFRRDAVQRMIRPLTFDEFCRRCERQGRSQMQFSRFYDDRAVRSWCQVDDAEARWSEAREVLDARVARVHELERLLASAAETDRDTLRQELHGLYHWTFNAFKAKGIVEAARESDAAP